MLWRSYLDLINIFEALQRGVNSFKGQFHKMVKHTETLRRQFANELFECVWPFYGIGA